MENKQKLKKKFDININYEHEIIKEPQKMKVWQKYDLK